MSAIKRPYLSASTYATPKSVSDDRYEKREPVGRMHIVIPHGKGTRAIQIELSEDDLLTIIANAADSIRYLRQGR